MRITLKRMTSKAIGRVSLQRAKRLVGSIWTLHAPTAQIDSLRARLQVETNALNRVAQHNALAAEYEMARNDVGLDSNKSLSA